MCDALRVVMGRRLDIHKILHAWLCYDTILQFSVKRIEIDLDKHFKKPDPSCDVRSEASLPCTSFGVLPTFIMPACTTMLSYDFSSNRGEEQAYIKRNAGKEDGPNDASQARRGVVL
jgi:hypothetical protein